MDDDEAREMMEKVVAEREEDAAELRRAGNKALREQRERIRAAQGLVEKAQAMGEPDLVLVFREVDYSEWRDTFPAERWATGYPGAESTKYYRLRKDAPVEAPAVSTIGAEFARGWNGGLGDTTKTKRLIDAAITLRESLPLYWHGPQETEFDEALDDWKSSRVDDK